MENGIRVTVNRTFITVEEESEARERYGHFRVGRQRTDPLPMRRHRGTKMSNATAFDSYVHLGSYSSSSDGQVERHCKYELSESSEEDDTGSQEHQDLWSENGEHVSGNRTLISVKEESEEHHEDAQHEEQMEDFNLTRCHTDPLPLRRLTGSESSRAKSVKAFGDDSDPPCEMGASSENIGSTDLLHHISEAFWDSSNGNDDGAHVSGGRALITLKEDDDMLCEHGEEQTELEDIDLVRHHTDPLPLPPQLEPFRALALDGDALFGLRLEPSICRSGTNETFKEDAPAESRDIANVIAGHSRERTLEEESHDAESNMSVEGRGKTTVKLCHFSCKCILSSFDKELWEAGFVGLFGFLYLPVKIGWFSCMSHALVNFVDPLLAYRFSQIFNASVWRIHASHQGFRVILCHLPGYDVSHFQLRQQSTAGVPSPSEKQASRVLNRRAAGERRTPTEDRTQPRSSIYAQLQPKTSRNFFRRQVYNRDQSDTESSSDDSHDEHGHERSPLMQVLDRRQ